MSDYIAPGSTMIKTFNGDTCPVTFTDLQEGMLIGLQVRDTKKNEPMFEELRETVDSEGNVTFVLTPEHTNKLKVRLSDGYTDYWYGIKQIVLDSGVENTILLGEKPCYSDRYVIRVYPKKVEGIIEDNE